MVGIGWLREVKGRGRQAPTAATFNMRERLLQLLSRAQGAGPEGSGKNEKCQTHLLALSLPTHSVDRTLKTADAWRLQRIASRANEMIESGVINRASHTAGCDLGIEKALHVVHRGENRADLSTIRTPLLAAMPRWMPRAMLQTLPQRLLDAPGVAPVGAPEGATPIPSK
ncbi:MAG: hypothetical protein DRH08_00040 [Deltaproteobacteria bacterium]|nr:MAG: hypothetical protein DRH08_00040 [Deltaproteobacteria bacterium]